jgi:hypothetical protein
VIVFKDLQSRERKVVGVAFNALVEFLYVASYLDRTIFL